MIRFLFLSAVLAVELTILSLSVDGQTLLAQTGLVAHLIGAWGMPTVRFLITTLGLTGTFAWLRRRAAFDTFLQGLSNAPWRIHAVALQLLLFGLLLTIGRRLYTASDVSSAWLAAAFVVVGMAVLVSGIIMVAPLRLWAGFAHAIGSLWASGAVVALGVQWMTAGWRLLWVPASHITYVLVQWMVRPLVGRLIIDPARMRIATARFGVIISPECSGMEGIGLLLLFGALWLWLYRRECRFPQALLLLPAGILILFVLNSGRIAMLLMIGHAGAPQIATEGFHSQAGWIAFNGVAFGLCIAARRIPWITIPAVTLGAAEVDRPPVMGVNTVGLYLGPFLAILAAGMVARAMTGGFEWMYPLRVVAPCAIFWICRRQYSNLDWQFTWRGPVIGLIAFAVWMAFEWALSGVPVSGTPQALTAAPGVERWLWIAFRLLGGIVLVPIAEELAFRGYVMRRVVAEGFDSVSAANCTILALGVSSLLFGIMHGSRWEAGTAAGLLYGWAYMRKGHLGDAVVAHAVTNIFIAAVVLGLGWWKLW